MLQDGDSINKYSNKIILSKTFSLQKQGGFCKEYFMLPAVLL